jgi:hypothetical protein
VNRRRRPVVNRRRVLLVAGAVALVVAVVVGLSLRDRGGSNGLKDVPPDLPRALVHARSACTSMTRVEELVRANASADDVMGEVGRASASGKEAASYDIKWLPLSSGIEAVRVGLKNDDGPAARVGIQSVRGQCDAVATQPQP